MCNASRTRAIPQHNYVSCKKVEVRYAGTRVPEHVHGNCVLCLNSNGHNVEDTSALTVEQGRARYGVMIRNYMLADSSAGQSSGPDVASIATGTISVVGCIAVAAAGTATAKYVDVRLNNLLLASCLHVEKDSCLHHLTYRAGAQTEIGLYIFWAIYVVVIGAYAANKLGGSKS